MMSARTAIIDAIVNGAKPFSSPLYTAIYVVGPMLSIFAAFIFLIESKESKTDRIWVWTSITVALVFSILTTGRTWILQLIVGLAGIYLLKTRRVSAKSAWGFVRWPLVAFLALFSVLAVVNKDTSTLESGASGAIEQYGFGYAVTPLAGLNYAIRHSAEYEHDPNHTFRQILPVLAPLWGSKYVAPLPLDDFVFVPLPTNVYTVFKFYFVDFGFAGMLVAMFVIGAGQTWLFRKAFAGAHFYVFLFAISLFPLIIATFNDEYSEIAGYGEALLFAGLYFGWLRRISWRGRMHAASVKANSVLHDPADGLISPL